MSKTGGPNREIVRRAWEAWREEGLDAWLEFFDPEVEYVPVDRWLDPATRHGRAELRSFMNSYLDDWAEWSTDVREIVDAGDKVMVRTRAYGRGIKSGIELHGRLYHVCTLRHGKIVRLQDFIEHEPARRAAGLD